MKSITVRKNLYYIWFFRISAVVFTLCLLGMMCWEPMYEVLLLVPALILILLLLHYETWRIVFEQDRIVKKGCFGRNKDYSWSQLQKVSCARSFTEGEQIRMVFTDGKMLIFRLDDHNARKAADRINKHRSIEMLT